MERKIEVDCHFREAEAFCFGEAFGNLLDQAFDIVRAGFSVFVHGYVWCSTSPGKPPAATLRSSTDDGEWPPEAGKIQLTGGGTVGWETREADLSEQPNYPRQKDQCGDKGELETELH